MNNLTQVDPEIEGLFATEPQNLPFGSSPVARSFLLERKLGNLLIYSTENIELDAIEKLGGADRQYLNHGHEAMFLPDKLEVPLYCHEKDSPSVKKKTEIASTFSKQHMLDDDFEIIPTSGHTLGTTCYLWDNGNHRILFTGDMLHLHPDKWAVAVLEESDRASYIESLERIRELDFDVLMPWVAH